MWGVGFRGEGEPIEGEGERIVSRRPESHPFPGQCVLYKTSILFLLPDSIRWCDRTAYLMTIVSGLGLGDMGPWGQAWWKPSIAKGPPQLELRHMGQWLPIAGTQKRLGVTSRRSQAVQLHVEA